MASTTTGTRRTLGRRPSFWTAAAVAALALWTSAAPSVSYPLYAAEWHLTPATTNAIFAVYPIVLVLVLIVLGDLSDHIGRRASILLGLAAILVGVLLFAVAPHVAWVFVGRAFMGLGVGLSLSPASAAMVELSPPGQVARASSITTAATASGLALATLVGGALVQYAPYPLHLDYAVLAVIVAGVLVLTWFLPRRVADEDTRPWRPRGLSVPRELRGTFATAVLAVGAAYALGSVVLAMGAQIAHQLVGSTNTLVTGAMLSVSAVVIGVVAVLSRRFPSRSLIAAGTVASIVGLGLLILSAGTHSLVVFFAASALTGAGYSFNFLGGLTLVNAHAPARHRAGLLSAVFVVAYLMQGATALVLGAVATASGMAVALELGSPVIGVVCIAALLLALLVRRAAPVAA
jgi:MFS family permease